MACVIFRFVYFANTGSKKEKAAAPAQDTDLKGSSVRELSDKERKRTEAEKRQQLSVKLRPLKQKVESLEKEIAGLESRHKEIETAMLDPELYKNGAEAKKVASDRKEIEQHLAHAYDQWETLQSEIEKVRIEL